MRTSIRRVANFRGRVQGVGFRMTVLGIARNFSVTGWVRNESDGSVCCLVEGTSGDVEAFTDSILRQMEDHVLEHDFVDESVTGEFEDFQIRN